MKSIGIIIARGGSKRIPRKNIVDFHGKPLLCWTIEAALESKKFDRIVVSTDDAEIATVAQAAGVEVPFLRQEAADDLSPSSLATLAALEQAQEHWQESYDIVTQLMPNCPLRRSSDIIAAYEQFIRTDAPFQISCFQFGWMNAWWAAKLGPDFKPEFLFPEGLQSRSQDLPPLYCPTGAIWIAKAAALQRSRSYHGEGLTFFPMDWRAAVDIDTVEDLEFANAIFPLMNGRHTNDHDT